MGRGMGLRIPSRRNAVRDSIVGLDFRHLA